MITDIDQKETAEGKSGNNNIVKETQRENIIRLKHKHMHEKI